MYGSPYSNLPWNKWQLLQFIAAPTLSGNRRLVSLSKRFPYKICSLFSCVKMSLSSGTVYFISVGLPSSSTRSEERRVGKECRSGWGPGDDEKGGEDRVGGGGDG